MKLLIIFTALLIACNAKVILTGVKDKDPALQFVECVRKALDGGLPEAGIPDHNPLVSDKVIIIPIDPDLPFRGNFTIQDIIIRDIVDFKVNSLTPEKVKYEYNLSWDNLVLEAQWILDYYTFLGPDKIFGNFTLDLQNLTLTGLWDQPEELTNLQLNFNTSNAKVLIQGISQELDEGLSYFLTDLVTSTINSITNWDFLSKPLQNKINSDWIENPTRIDAIIKNCQ